MKEIIIRVFRGFRGFGLKKKSFFPSFVYLLLLIVLRWRLQPRLEILFFLIGGVFGVYFLDLAEKIFKGKMRDVENMRDLGETEKRSPFKNVLVQGACLLLIFFVLTSSGSFFGTGMVLTMFLQMLLGQYQEFKQTGSLNSWFWVIKTEISSFSQKIYLFIISGVFILLNLLFI